MKLYYNSNLKMRSRKLRSGGTLAEVLLWNKLKARRFLGLQFYRQKPIGKYIADFYCKELDLVIEVDGSSHRDRYEYDATRQAALEALGLAVLRFEDEQVRKGMDSVLKTLEVWVEEKRGAVHDARE
jgi:very-short-patch-repair endonuclease